MIASITSRLVDAAGGVIQPKFSDLARAEIEHRLELLLAERERDPYRSAIPRMRRAVTNTIRQEASNG